MFDNLYTGRYLSNNSKIHKLNSTFKVMSLMIMIICALFINSFEDIIMLASYLFLVILYSDIGIRIYIKEVLYFKLLIFFILVVDIITINPIEIIISDLFRIIFIIIYLSLFIHTTTINETMYGIERILDPFDLKRNRVFILYTSLLFKFPATFKDTKDKINRLYEERRIKKETSIKDKILFYVKKIRRIFNLSIKTLNNMFMDMKLKLYGYGKSRTNYRLNKFSVKEVLLLMLEIIILVIVIFY